MEEKDDILHYNDISVIQFKNLCMVTLYFQIPLYE